MTNRRLSPLAKPAAWLLLACAPWLTQAQTPAAAPSSTPATPTRPAVTTVTPVTATSGTSTQAAAADYIVAIVNTEPITAYELRQRVRRTEQQLTQQGGKLPSAAVLRAEVLDLLIQERIQLQLARDNGIQIDADTLEQTVRDVARQNQLSVEALYRRLAQDGVSQAQFREQLGNQWVLSRLRERELTSRIKISEAEIDQFLREQRGGTDHPEQDLNLAQILIPVPEQASEAELARLQALAADVARRAQAGENFRQLVHEFSKSAERDQNGEFGLRSSQRYPALFLDATAKLPVGGISAVVRSGAGFHVLKVVERRDAGQTVTQTHARHILLRLSPQLNERAAQTKLAELREQVLTGKADFAELARKFSQDGSAAQGGDLGWAAPGQFVPEFEQVMDQLAPNEVSPPLVSRFGVHLLQVLERRQVPLTEREQRELARNALREKKLDESYASWAEELRSRAYVELRDAP